MRWGRSIGRSVGRSVSPVSVDLRVSDRPVQVKGNTGHTRARAREPERSSYHSLQRDTRARPPRKCTGSANSVAAADRDEQTGTTVTTIAIDTHNNDDIVNIMSRRHHVLALIAVALVSTVLTAEGASLLGAPHCPEPFGVQAYAHPDDCNSFFLCTNGTLTLEQCENGLLFDGKGAVHNHCNYNWAVHCGNRKADLTPLSSGYCEYQFGLYPDSDSCSQTYTKCAYGEPHQAHCDAGLVYDEKSHTCVWPDQLLPYCNPESVVGFKCPSKPPSGPAAKFWPYPRFPVPGDCGRLITCVDGHPRLITCGEDKLFDSESLSCLDKDEFPHCA